MELEHYDIQPTICAIWKAAEEMPFENVDERTTDAEYLNILLKFTVEPKPQVS